uniref:Uncharacterized protein n=1 Tax=Arundo donax TaxID=35708 RepID=A0A0A9GJU2_ARUDO
MPCRKGKTERQHALRECISVHLFVCQYFPWYFLFFLDKMI